MSMCENNNLTLNTAKTKEIIVEEEEIPPATGHLGAGSGEGTLLGYPHQ